ncbi:tetratricopeptide repeat protein 38-like isoform X2 [Brevipalpus obovatus]|uniref:tetratricopeptide repeat protein 38-like isoform X2 n=1 Tax=Brevipalpus obovatus TaxID=246614 RepID=UPI003D9E2CF7
MLSIGPIMGRCLEVGLLLNSTVRNPEFDQESREKLNLLNQTVKAKSKLYPREKRHVEAVRLFASGDPVGATLEWEKILIEHPTDIHALRMALDSYFWRGVQREMRDSVARVLPFWQSGALPLKEYLYGMHAFGLCETNLFEKAEAQARKGLKRNINDAWAAHAIAHVYEMQGKAVEGFKFLDDNEKNWSVCNHFSGHMYWHEALFKIEMNAYDEASQIMENILLTRAKNIGGPLAIVDLNSLLYRLHLTGSENLVRPGHWNAAYEVCKPYLRSHGTSFNDAHFLMAALGSDNVDVAEEILESYKDIDPLISGPKDVVTNLLKAMIAYKREQYSEAVELLIPVRSQFRKIGGSEAQRDLFSQLLIVSAIKSKSEYHRKLAEHLLNERDGLRSNSFLDGRLVNRLNQI